MEEQVSPEVDNSPAQWYGDESKTLVETKGWNSADEALKSYSELEKSMGGRVKVPGEDATPEDRKAFYSKLGCPDTIDGYELDVSETVPRDESVENSLKQVALDNGVSKQAFEAIVKDYYGQMEASMAAGREAGEASLKEEFGDKYDENLAIAKRFCETRSDEFKAMLEDTGIGNNPVFVKEFVDMGRKIMSDSLIKGDTTEANSKDYAPKYVDSPGMYATGDDEESKKARAYFEARGHKY